MAAIASASPVPVHPYSLETRRHPARVALRSAASRSQMKQSPRTNNLGQSYARPSDSSDDEEELAPIKLSAEAQAILGEENAQAQSDKENIEPPRYGMKPSDFVNVQSHGPWSPQERNGSPAPRLIHIPASSRPSPPAVLERDGSFAYKIHDKSRSYGMLESDSKSPAPRLRRVRVSGSRSQTKSPGSAETAERQTPQYEPGQEKGPQEKGPQEKGPQEKGPQEKGPQEKGPQEEDPKPRPEHEEGNPGPYSISRPRRTKDTGAHSTIRASKIGRGRYLNGPVRRGVIRRQSDDEEAHGPYKESAEYSPEVQQGRRAEVELDNKPDDLLIEYESPQPRKRASPPNVDHGEMMQCSQSPALQEHDRSRSPPKPIAFSASIGRQHPTPAPIGGAVSSRSSSSKRPMFKIPSLPPLESTNDQENEPPPTFRRTKPAALELQINEDAQIESEKQSELPEESRESPRQPLATRSNNTPRRPAPAPPPKMSLVDAMTSNAGNSRAKKSVHYVLNGRTYRRLDCIGRGGSCRVFRVMAENYKMLALKRVNLEEADMAAIAGYKGEIELLKRLASVDRVIKLIDYEINEDKGVLNVMMELGETDFNTMLRKQLEGDNSKLDITFTRHYWKEMLECVGAVHGHDIVHSDLKPANFLLVKGQLKLIDFGISNAIQENTVNVHRENQIGTPNYMSPESLVCHTPVAGQAAGTKLLKLGKPSDVWSLGCILYQMTYGQPPFAHIQKQFERIMSIPNPKVEIQFPSTGIGGSVVPFGLIKTLKRCLQRDQTLRPTIKELLSEADPFLNPVAISPDMLGRVIGNVVSYCRKREESFRQAGQLGQEGISCLPRDEDMRGWPLAFYEKLKQAQEEGTAW